MPLALLMLVAPLLGPASSAQAAEDAREWPRLCPTSNRFGIALPGTSDITNYDIGQLHAGWYHNFGMLPIPARPAGLGYVQTIRLSDDYHLPQCEPLRRACCSCPTWDQLSAVVQANPGSLWLLGNEPDRIAIQDGVTPENYARLYHDFYRFLKAKDPSSQVGVGGVVQPTPVRLEYLGMILDAYQGFYGTQMPVDVWNVHNYVLREKRMYSGCPDCWGADIPPGVPENVGMLYEIDDHDNMAYWTSHIIAFRRWMSDRGYRDRPLVISEYGILMPVIYGYTYERVRTFMLATFDWMMTAADPDSGYPADGNRLVQAWNWYSVDDKGFEGYFGFSHLFDPDSRAITPLGIDYGAYTAGFTSPDVELQMVTIRHTQPQGINTVTITVTAEVANQGTSAVQNVLVRFSRDGIQAGETVIPSINAGEAKTASVLWPNLELGQSFQVTATADPDGQIPECDSLGNSLTVPLLVADRWYYLPLTYKLW